MNLNDIKDQYFPVLDYGFVAVKDWMGTDSDIAEMARNSYKLGTKSVSSDTGLIRHLMRNRHTSPFERCELVLHCGMPIFVARQWVRHRTASLNEYSGRYSIMPLLFYTPEKKRCRRQSTTNKQGSDQCVCFSDQSYNIYRETINDLRRHLSNHYELSVRFDMARELARIDLPLSMYTYWYWKIDLHNLLHFLELRLDKDAQWEIRQYAQIIAGIVKIWLPETWRAFKDYRLNGVYFSRGETQLLRFLYFKGNTAWERTTFDSKAKELGLNKRETEEFLEKWKKMRGDEVDYELDLNTARGAVYYEKLAQDNSVEIT